MSFESVVTESGQFMYDNFHFSEATKSNGFLFCSGVIGTDAKGEIPEDPSEEFRNAWTGIGRVLAECGLAYDDILECTTYHVGLQSHLEAFMAIRDEFVSEPWPAWTAIGITELAIPGARVEIKVIATLAG